MIKQPISVFPKQLDDLLKKLGKSSQSYAKELAKKLGRQTQEAIETLIKYQTQKIGDINQGIEELYLSVAEQCRQFIRGPYIRFDIPSEKIRQAQNKTAFCFPYRSEIIKGKAVVVERNGSTPLEVDCVIASTNWHKLGEIKGDTINLVDHLDKLIPIEKRKMFHEERIGLVTFQNGMANKLDGFIKSAQSIFDHFTEAPLCIGLYNPTIVQWMPSPVDMIRFPNEKMFNMRAVFSLCQMMKTFADILPKINPNLLWVHFAHSEGGLIANAALEVCDQLFFRDTHQYLTKNLIAATYGAVKPIPDEYAKFAINTYSKNDIALFFGKDYIDLDVKEMIKNSEPIKKVHKGKTYTIKIIDSKTERTEKIKMPVKMPDRLSLKETLQLSFFEYVAYREEIDAAPWTTQVCVNIVNDFAYRIKDHGFDEASYKGELKRNAEEFKKRFKI